MASRWSQTDWGEKVIIVMIGIEILLSLATIGLTVYEARGQDELLENILRAQTKVDADLADVDSKLGDLDTGMMQTATAVTASATTSNKINAALGSQLRILAQEQELRLKELARKPDIHAQVGGVPADRPYRTVTAKELSDTRAVFEIVFRNAGNLALVGGLARITVDDANVKISASNTSAVPMPSSLAKTGNLILAPLARLSPEAWQLIVLTVEYPKGTPPFNIGLTVDADNLPLTPLGSIHVSPPAPASPVDLPQ